MSFEVAYLEEARKFLKNLPEKDQDKILFNIMKVQNGVKDTCLFKKLEGTNIWEFRTDYNGNAYRLLSFWDQEERSLVIATHGFSKKAQKTPRKEINKAEQIRKDYFKQKAQTGK